LAQAFPQYFLANQGWCFAMVTFHSVVALFGVLGVQGDVGIRGTFRIQQKETMRYLDAYGTSNDFKVITRGWQSNPSQWWYLESVGDLQSQIYTIQQVGDNNGASVGRFLDAYEDSSHDYYATTRTNQHNPSQQWHLTATATAGDDTYTIQEVGHNNGALWSPARYLDAYEGSHDGLAVTRGWQGNPSQEWVLTPLLPGEEVPAQQLVANFTQPRSLQIMAPLCIIAGISMLALVMGLTRRRNQLLPDGGTALLDSEHKAETV